MSLDIWLLGPRCCCGQHRGEFPSPLPSDTDSFHPSVALSCVHLHVCSFCLLLGDCEWHFRLQSSPVPSDSKPACSLLSGRCRQGLRPRSTLPWTRALVQRWACDQTEPEEPPQGVLIWSWENSCTYGAQSWKDVLGVLAPAAPSPWGRRVGLSGEGGKAEVGRGKWPWGKGSVHWFLTLRGLSVCPRAGRDWARWQCDSPLCGSRFGGSCCTRCSLSTVGWPEPCLW